MLRAAGFEVRTIRRQEFDHGGTRQLAADALEDDADVIVFLTQDAIPADATAVASLLGAFADASVAAAYGRQLPHAGAGVAGAHARRFNYPAESRVKALGDSAAH